MHGGATLRDERSTDEPGFEAKSSRNTREKHAIAIAAAALVRSGTAIGITAGTTTWQLAYHIADIANLTVVTNSVRVAEVLHQSQRSDRTVVLTGGVRTPSDALVGPVAVAALRSLHLDSVFMGVHGMNARAGFTTPNLMEAETNRAFVDATEHLVVLADHTKWDITGLSSMATLERGSRGHHRPRPARRTQWPCSRSGSAGSFWPTPRSPTISTPLTYAGEPDGHGHVHERHSHLPGRRQARPSTI